MQIGNNFDPDLAGALAANGKCSTVSLAGALP